MDASSRFGLWSLHYVCRSLFWIVDMAPSKVFGGPTVPATVFDHDLSRHRFDGFDRFLLSSYRTPLVTGRDAVFLHVWILGDGYGNRSNI